jgi:hypothetical protein
VREGGGEIAQDVGFVAAVGDVAGWGVGFGDSSVEPWMNVSFRRSTSGTPS